MERLTEYHEGVAVIRDKSLLPQAMAKLAAYEETGLTPAEIMDGKMLTGWIPVSERLPTMECGYAYVLVCMDDGFIATTEYIDEGFDLWKDSGDVIACMPLWCGSLRVNMDDRQVKQLLYHILSIAKYSNNVSANLKNKLITDANLKVANEFHRVKECGVLYN